MLVVHIINNNVRGHLEDFCPIQSGIFSHQKIIGYFSKSGGGNRRISGLGVYWGKGESHKFSKKKHENHWVVTIIAQKVIRVGEKHHFLSESKNILTEKLVENVCYSRAFISSTKV